MRKCSRCGKNKNSSKFTKGRNTCRDCKRDINKNSQNKTRERNQQYIIDYLTKNPCNHCGEDDIIVLEFNHLGNKTDDVSNLLNKGSSLERLIEEINKCEVLCANCHKRFTAKQQNNYRFRYIH